MCWKRWALKRVRLSHRSTGTVLAAVSIFALGRAAIGQPIWGPLAQTLPDRTRPLKSPSGEARELEVLRCWSDVAASGWRAREWLLSLSSAPWPDCGDVWLPPGRH